MFAAVAVLALLALSVPLQYLVRSEVVVGLSPQSAHSHAHGSEEESEHGHAHEGGEGGIEAHVQLGVNLIPNFGFEVGTYEQIWGWTRRPDSQGATLYRDDKTSHGGLASAAVATNGNDVSDLGWLMKLDVVPLEHDVVFEGYVRTEGLQGRAYLRVVAETLRDGGGGTQVLFWASSESVSGDSDWSPRDIRCNIPAQTSGVWLEIGVDGVGSAWFDDLSLRVEESAGE